MLPADGPVMEEEPGLCRLSGSWWWMCRKEVLPSLPSPTSAREAKRVPVSPILVFFSPGVKGTIEFPDH